MSAEYPTTTFIITSGRRVHGREVAPLIFRLEEASYLAGMVAGALTRSNVIGFVGGIELPPIEAAYQGWVNGATAVESPGADPQGLPQQLRRCGGGAGSGVGADPGGRGHVPPQRGRGGARAFFRRPRRAPGVYVFGSNDDQAHLAPERVVGSAVIDLPRAFLTVARELKEGSFRPRVESFGLESGVVRYVPNPGARVDGGQALTLPTPGSRRFDRRRHPDSRATSGFDAGSPIGAGLAADAPPDRAGRLADEYLGSAKCRTSGTRSTACRSRTAAP